MEGCSAPLVVKFADTQREKEQKKIQQMHSSILSIAAAAASASATGIGNGISNNGNGCATTANGTTGPNATNAAAAAALASSLLASNAAAAATSVSSSISGSGGAGAIGGGMLSGTAGGISGSSGGGGGNTTAGSATGIGAVNAPGTVGPLITNPPPQANPFIAAEAISPSTSLQLLQQLQSVGMQHQHLMQGEYVGHPARKSGSPEKTKKLLLILHSKYGREQQRLAIRHRRTGCCCVRVFFVVVRVGFHCVRVLFYSLSC